MCKKLLALALGTAFFLLACELGLRAYGLGWAYARHGSLTGAVFTEPPAKRGERVVLCVGNSHTQGLVANPEFAYPAQLEKKLREKDPGVRVVNAGRVNRNSTELLLMLPELLEVYRPRVVTLMLGEPNLWNSEHLAEFIAGRPPAPSLLSRLRLVRLFRLLASKEFSLRNSLPNPGYSRQFRDVPLADSNTLAMKWVGFLSDPENLAAAAKNTGSLTEARGALERWSQGPGGGRSRLALRILAELELLEGRKGEALDALEKAQKAAPSLDYGAFSFLRDRQAAFCEGLKTRCEALKASLYSKRPPGFEKLLALLDPPGAIPPGARYRLLQSLNEKELRLLFGLSPSSFLLHGFFSPALARLFDSGRGELAYAAFYENPFHPRQEVPENLIRRVAGLRAGAGQEAAEKELTDEFNALFPSAALLTPGFHAGEQAAWLERDLREAVKLVRAAGAEPVLETYPPFRRGLGERNPDPVIRRVAAELDVPLADHYDTLRGQFQKEDSEGFYRKAGEASGDDHLNARGNAALAASLADLIGEKGWLR